ARLPYALAICKESLRLYPPAYFTGRKTLVDFTLGRYAIPGGTLVMLSPYTLHRRADYFADPLRFAPERFAAEHEGTFPRHAYIPFGGGPRVCIGNHFALMEMHLLLVTLAQQVTFTAHPGPVVAEPLVTLRPKGGLAMTVQHRDAQVAVSAAYAGQVG
ncbi:MAG: cytochrome P450, partial [Ktedonobacterales bacterium]|nr:cytochrome P450 [Ktedonobacterales bacterium]